MVKDDWILESGTKAESAFAIVKIQWLVLLWYSAQEKCDVTSLLSVHVLGLVLKIRLLIQIVVIVDFKIKFLHYWLYELGEQPVLIRNSLVAWWTVFSFEPLISNFWRRPKWSVWLFLEHFLENIYCKSFPKGLYNR